MNSWKLMRRLAPSVETAVAHTSGRGWARWPAACAASLAAHALVKAPTVVPMRASRLRASTHAEHSHHTAKFWRAEAAVLAGRAASGERGKPSRHAPH